MVASTEAVKSLNTFIVSFNRRDKDGVLSNLHFPLYTHSDGGEPVIIESADAFWHGSAHQVQEMKRLEDWVETTLDFSQVLDATENTVWIQIEISRRNSSGEAYGVARGADQASNLGYNITVGDVKVSAEMQKGAGTDRTFGFQYTGVENMTLVYGQGEVNPGQTNGGNDETVMGIKYSVAGATLAYMVTEVDIGGVGAADEDATHMGVSFAVNDDLTISYAVQDVDITGAGHDEKNSGFGVSYTMGSMSVAAYAGKTENGNGAPTADDEGKGLTLSIAF